MCKSRAERAECHAALGVLSFDFESAIEYDLSQTAYTSKVSEMMMSRLCCSRLPTAGVAGIFVVGSLVSEDEKWSEVALHKGSVLSW